MNLNGSSAVTFGPFRLEPRDLRLDRDGQPVRLPMKAVETLVLLVRAHLETVSREELRAALWPDAVVEDSNLHQNIYLLRKALGALPDGRSYIETLAKRGYRFLGDPVAEA